MLRFVTPSMTVFEIELPVARTAAVQLSAAATAVGGAAQTLAQLQVSPEQVGAPDGAVLAEAVQRYAARASRRLAGTGDELRTNSMNVRTACTSYSHADESTAARLLALRCNDPRR